MKKICLALVLSIVSVFSISAQTINKSTAGTVQTEAVKVESESPKVESESPKAETETVKTTVRTSPTDVPQEPKPRVIDSVENSKLPGLPSKKISLGGLSTGNSTVDGYIEEFSTLFDVDPRLIYAQMNQESSFNGRATSSKGASGFMQLMPDTARRFGVTNIYNTKQNIKAGVKYMRWLLDKFDGDPRLALAGYNAGEGAVIKYGNKIPPYRETQNYVVRIMTHYEQISNQNQTLAQNDRQLNK
jgi:soluble lytic murein transglycosylase-like protein